MEYVKDVFFVKFSELRLYEKNIARANLFRPNTVNRTINTTLTYLLVRKKKVVGER